MRLAQGDNVCEFDRTPGDRTYVPPEQLAFVDMLDWTKPVYCNGVEGIITKVDYEGGHAGIINLRITWVRTDMPVDGAVPWSFRR